MTSVRQCIATWIRDHFGSAKPLRRRSTVTLVAEAFEERVLPSTGQTFIVDDPGSLTPTTGTLTLAQAIALVNADTGVGAPDRILFNIPSASGSVEIDIDAGNPLPIITQPVIIDGTSEVAFAGAVVRLHGDAGGSVDGLSFGAGSDGSSVQRLVIDNFAGAAIELDSSGNTILGCTLGTDPTGATASASFYGISIRGANNQIGGTTSGDRNLLSGNIAAGVLIEGANATGNQVLGNFIGTDAAGTTALGNGVGIRIDGGAASTTIGGTAAGAGNVISGNNTDGIQIADAGSSQNAVLGNFIGTDVTGSIPLGNGGAGVFVLLGASDNTIGGTTSGSGNVIAFNFTGVAIGSSPADSTTVHNRILGNRIDSNGMLGIDLGFDSITANDVHPRPAPNDGQNAPLVTVVTASAVRGMLRTANGPYRIEVFATPSGFPFHGAVFLGAVTIEVRTGTAAFVLDHLKLSKGALVTATATNLVSGDTSEFSLAATTTHVTTRASVAARGAPQVILLTAIITGAAPIDCGIVAFTIAGLPGRVLAHVNAHGVAIARFMIPANVAAGTYKIVAVYTPMDPWLTGNTSDPATNGLLTVLGSAGPVRGRRFLR